MEMDRLLLLTTAKTAVVDPHFLSGNSNFCANLPFVQLAHGEIPPRWSDGLPAKGSGSAAQATTICFYAGCLRARTLKQFLIWLLRPFFLQKISPALFFN